VVDTAGVAVAAGSHFAGSLAAEVEAVDSFAVVENRTVENSAGPERRLVESSAAGSAMDWTLELQAFESVVALRKDSMLAAAAAVEQVVGQMDLNL